MHLEMCVFFLGKCLLWDFQGGGGGDEGRDRRRRGEPWKNQTIALYRCASKKCGTGPTSELSPPGSELG